MFCFFERTISEEQFRWYGGDLGKVFGGKSEENP